MRTLLAVILPITVAVAQADEIERCYSVEEIGTLPGDDAALARALNQRGDVVGQSYRDPEDPLVLPVYHAFMWRGGSITAIGTLAGSESVPLGINDDRVIVGTAHDANEVRRAFIFDDSRLADLDTLGGSTAAALAINKAGQIVGVSKDSNGNDRAFIWEESVLDDLNTLVDIGPDIKLDVARAINDLGDIVGVGTRLIPAGPDQNAEENRQAIVPTGEGEGSQDGEFDSLLQDPGERYAQRAFLLSPAGDGYRLTWLDTPHDAHGSSPEDINDAGEVVGNITSTSGFLVTTQAFLWAGRRAVNLSPADDINVLAYALNNNGQVVGTVHPVGFLPVAVLWEDGVMHTLNDLVSPTAAGWEFLEARDINDAGQIVGSGLHDGREVAYLLTPCDHGSEDDTPIIDDVQPLDPDVSSDEGAHEDAIVMDDTPPSPSRLPSSFCGAGITAFAPLIIGIWIVSLSRHFAHRGP